MSTRPDDLDRLLRDTVAARGRELVPDSATPPPLDLDAVDGRGAHGPRPARTTPLRRPSWWLTTGLAAAAAAVLVAGTVALHAAETGAEQPAGPVPTSGPVVTTTSTPAPSSTPSPTTWTADPRPFTEPVGPSPATAVPTAPATTAPATTAPATTAPSTTAPAAVVGVYAWCNGPASDDPWVQRPATLSLACADAGEVLQDITWTSWGPTGAVGRATVVMKSCVPDCASGGVTRSATTVSLGQVGRDGSGRAVFTVARLGPDPIPTRLPEHPGYYVLQTHP